MNALISPYIWTLFCFSIAGIVGIDMGLLRLKNATIPSFRKSIFSFLFWMLLALSFNLFLYFYLASVQNVMIAKEKALEFLTGYLIEESLSIDNIFVFLMIFNFFKVPIEYQRRVLLYGVLGAIFLRLILICFGTWLVTMFHWILYVFGIILMGTGLKMMFFENNPLDLSRNPMVKWVRRYFKMTDAYHQENFFIKQQGLWVATPLFLVLVLIDFFDLIFAFDSIPAIFAITHDTFIIFSSNAFAVLGLRSLYFILAQMAQKFSCLKYGIGLVLIFVGIKMWVAPWVTIPIFISLATVITLLSGSVFWSFVF